MGRQSSLNGLANWVRSIDLEGGRSALRRFDDSNRITIGISWQSRSSRFILRQQTHSRDSIQRVYRNSHSTNRSRLFQSDTTGVNLRWWHTIPMDSEL